MSDGVRIDFSAFRSGPGGAMARNLGIPIDECSTWWMFTEAAVAANDAFGPGAGRVVAAARKLMGKAASGELAVLQAVLYAADFAWLADEFGAEIGGTWRKMESTGGEHLLAVAACVARID